MLSALLVAVLLAGAPAPLPADCHDICHLPGPPGPCCTECTEWLGTSFNRLPNAGEKGETLRACLTAQEKAKADELERQRAWDREHAAEIAEREAEVTRAIEEASAAATAVAVEHNAAPAEPQASHVAISAALCAYQANRESSLGGIREEQRYAKIGGVLNLSKVHAYQDHIRQTDNAIRESREWFKGEGLRALPCSNRLVRRLAACLGITWQRGFLDDPFTWIDTPRLTSSWEEDGDCSSDDLQPYMDTMRPE